jgi:hypothetical protein
VFFRRGPDGGKLPKKLGMTGCMSRSKVRQDFLPN